MKGGSGVQMKIWPWWRPDRESRCGLRTKVLLNPGQLSVEKGGRGRLSRGVNRGKSREPDRTHKMVDVISQAPEMVDRLLIEDSLRSIGSDPSDGKDESHPDVVWLVEGCGPAQQTFVDPVGSGGGCCRCSGGSCQLGTPNTWVRWTRWRPSNRWRLST